MTSVNFTITPIKYTGYTATRLADIFGFDKALLDIYSQRVLEMIKNNEEGWEKMIPKKVTKLIKEKNLFGYK